MITIKATFAQLLLPLAAAFNFSQLWSNVDQLTPAADWKNAAQRDVDTWSVDPQPPGWGDPQAWPSAPEPQGEDPKAWGIVAKPEGEGAYSWGNSAGPQPGESKAWEQENNLPGEDQQPQGWNVHRKSSTRHTADYEEYLKFKDFLRMKGNLAWGRGSYPN